MHYLRAVSWAIPGFSLDACAARLRTAHESPQPRPLTVRGRRFMIVAAKPG